MEGESCGRCRFWMATDEGPEGWCRRYPPQVVVEPDPEWMVETSWPETSANEWCGEFAPAIVSADVP